MDGQSSRDESSCDFDAADMCESTKGHRVMLGLGDDGDDCYVH